MADIPTTVLALPQFLGGLAIPGTAFLIMIVLSFVARKSPQSAGHFEVGTAAVASVLMVALALLVLVLAPKTAAAPQAQLATSLPEKIAAGQDLYSLNCAECHGPDGEGGVIQGVAGLEGFNMKAIHSQDEMYTRDDQSLAEIISYGQPNLGMQPFGSAYGGTLSPTDIENIVTFLRYSWDDRAELPAGAVVAGGIPALNPGEVPSYDVHIGPLVKRYCQSCHQAGKVNDNYLLTTYDEMLNSGDNKPVLTSGDSQSLLLLLVSGHTAVDPKTGQTIRQMPPTKLLDPMYIDMLNRWVKAGMPTTAAEAAKAKP
jgi:mono/diheme cytochrome c family protein